MTIYKNLNPLTTNVPHHIEINQLIDWFLRDEKHWSLMG